MREADVKLYQGRNVNQVVRDMGITEQTYYHWVTKYEEGVTWQWLPVERESAGGGQALLSKD